MCAQVRSCLPERCGDSRSAANVPGTAAHVADAAWCSLGLAGGAFLSRNHTSTCQSALSTAPLCTPPVPWRLACGRTVPTHRPSAQPRSLAWLVSFQQEAKLCRARRAARSGSSGAGPSMPTMVCMPSLDAWIAQLRVVSRPLALAKHPKRIR